MNPNRSSRITLDELVARMDWRRPGYHLPIDRVKRPSGRVEYLAQPEKGLWWRLAPMKNEFWYWQREYPYLRHVIRQQFLVEWFGETWWLAQKLSFDRAQKLADEYDAAVHPWSHVMLKANTWVVPNQRILATAELARPPILPFELPALRWVTHNLRVVFWGNLAEVDMLCEVTHEWLELWRDHEPELSRANILVEPENVHWVVTVYLRNLTAESQP